MKKQLIIFFLFMSMAGAIFSQRGNDVTILGTSNAYLYKKTLSDNEMRRLKQLKYFKGMELVEGGVFSTPEQSNKNIKFNLEDSTLVYCDNAPRNVVNSFYICDHEITNGEYQEFITWVKDSIARAHPEDPSYNYRKYDNDELFKPLSYNNELLKYNDIFIYPDTLCWMHTKHFYEFQPYSNIHGYFNHPAYKNYPVVGVNWHQAMAYCEWKTRRLNNEAAQHKLNITLSLRLPTEAEWQYATFIIENKHKKVTYINDELFYFYDKKGKRGINMGSIVDKNGIKVYNNHAYFYTSKVKSFAPNNFKLYDMLGNVSEWVLDSAYVPDSYTGLPKEMQSDTLDYYNRISEQLTLYSTKSDKLEILTEIMNRKLQDSYKLYYPEQMDLFQKFNMEYEVLSKIRTEIICNNPDSKIVKGGSWEDGAINQQCNTREIIDSWDSKCSIGFRIAMGIEYR